MGRLAAPTMPNVERRTSYIAIIQHFSPFGCKAIKSRANDWRAVGPCDKKGDMSASKYDQQVWWGTRGAILMTCVPSC